MFRRRLADWKGWKLLGVQGGNSCKGYQMCNLMQKGLQRGFKGHFGVAATYEGQHAMYSLLLLTVVLKMVP
jgi:hypothetical protein